MGGAPLVGGGPGVGVGGDGGKDSALPFRADDADADGGFPPIPRVNLAVRKRGKALKAGKGAEGGAHRAAVRQKEADGSAGFQAGRDGKAVPLGGAEHPGPAGYSLAPGRAGNPFVGFADFPVGMSEVSPVDADTVVVSGDDAPALIGRARIEALSHKGNGARGQQQCRDSKDARENIGRCHRK